VVAILVAVVLAAALILPVLRVLAESGQLPRPLVRHVERLKSVWVVRLAWAAVILVGLIVLASQGGAGLVLSFLILATLVAYLAMWVHEFLFLMGLTDQDFPGRYDKLIWAGVLVALGPLGLWVFHRYRLATWVDPAAAPAKPAALHDWY